MGEIKWVDYLFRKYDNSETSIHVGYRLLPTRIIGDNSLWPSDINRREKSVRSARSPCARSNSSESGRRVTRGNERRKKKKSRRWCLRLNYIAGDQVAIHHWPEAKFAFDLTRIDSIAVPSGRSLDDDLIAVRKSPSWRSRGQLAIHPSFTPSPLWAEPREPEPRFLHRTKLSSRAPAVAVAVD